MKRWIYMLTYVWPFAALCQQPLNQPVNFIVSNIKPYGFNISFTGSASDGYLVIRSTTPLSGVPIDGIEYEKGGGIGNGKIVSNSAATFSQIKEVHAGTTYYFTVFAHNGSGTSIDYLQSNPLTANIITPDNLIGNYYFGIDQNAENFVDDLHDLLQSTHTHVDYYEYNNTIIPAVFERDTIGGKKLVKCEYSGFVTQYYPPFGFTATDFSREHCLARSWMPSNATTDDPEAADYHNLLLTNLSNANTPRSNHPFGEVVIPSYTFMDCQLGYDSAGSVVFEPASHIKGDIARALFYEMVAWNGTGGNWGISGLSAIGPEQDPDILLNWHFTDPPDGAEKAKTEYIYFIQGNRNPFIDYPDWVSCIDWNDLSRYLACYTTIGIESEPTWEMNIYPNPAKIYTTVKLPYISNNMIISITDLYGQPIKTFKINQQLTNQPFTIDLSNVHCGVFMLKAETEKQQFVKKLIIQN